VIPLHTPVNKNTLRLCLKRERQTGRRTDG